MKNRKDMVLQLVMMVFYRKQMCELERKIITIRKDEGKKLVYLIKLKVVTL